MSSQHEMGVEQPTAEPFEAVPNWRAGAVSGVLAATAMGLAISVVGLETLQGSIAALYGFEGSLLAGWAAHLFHGLLFGLLFAWVLADPGLYRLTDWWWKTLAAAVVYALVLAVAGAGVVMPIWLELVGVSVPGGIPNVTVPLLAWHLVYGVVLGTAYPLAERFTVGTERSAVAG